MDKSFLNKLARVTSTLFVPPSFTIFIFTYFALVLEKNPTVKIYVILTAVIFGFLLHILLFLSLHKKGKLTDMDASIKEERTFPFLISILFYVSGLIILLYLRVSPVSIAFWFCYISNTILVVLINKFWKISVHSMGASGPLAALYFLMGVQSFIFIPLVLLVGWSRVRLKCHSPAQVAAGLIFGFGSTYFQMMIITGLMNYAK